MSDLCRQYCKNFTGCESRLSAAVAEGITLDGQEQAWKKATKTLPEKGAELVLLAVELEDRQIFDELDESGWAPHATESKSTTMLRRVEEEQRENQRGYGIVASELEAIARRQTRNTEDVTQLASGMDDITEAAAICPGPTLDLAGRLLVKKDRLLGSSTLPEFYLQDHAICASETASEVFDRMPIPEMQYVPSDAIGSVSKY